MDVSVIICTYNRAESLRRTLETCCELRIPDGLQWEVLVLDNNSTDRTKDVCREFDGRLPLRYAFEARQGKSFALNRSVVDARGDLLLFTDDDVDLDKMWITATWEAARRHPEAGFFGGKIIPKWESTPPRWLTDHSTQLLGGVTVHYDRGPQERLLASDAEVFLGANLTFRRKLFENGRRFREDLGPNARDPVRGEESKLMIELLHEGCKGVYVPAAVVHHRNSSDRMTERYLRQWFVGYGMSEVRCGEIQAGHFCFGAPLHVWKGLVSNAAKYLATRWTCGSSVWLPAEIKMATSWGVITEMRQQARLRKQSSDRTQESELD